jgi:hypothetical protein
LAGGGDGLVPVDSITKAIIDGFNDTESFLAALYSGLSDDFPDDISDSDLGIDLPRQRLD